MAQCFPPDTERVSKSQILKCGTEFHNQPSFPDCLGAISSFFSLTHQYNYIDLSWAWHDNMAKLPVSLKKKEGIKLPLIILFEIDDYNCLPCQLANVHHENYWALCILLEAKLWLVEWIVSGRVCIACHCRPLMLIYTPFSAKSNP